ncbi:Complexin [Fasciola hepatica]|uniref:Complexin n=1 Tax=Fasciola hepatica TaxID=6192 RepID=A0A4E0R3R5_FASHE|nr:Complexin [Fasciola hepatica]
MKQNRAVFITILLQTIVFHSRCALPTGLMESLMSSNNWKSVTKDVGPKGPTEEEIEASLNAAEEKRRERFENMEEERESMRQVIRDKYGIKKKELLDVSETESYRRPSTPRHSVLMVNPPKRGVEEEANTTIQLPSALREAASKAVELPQRLMSEANEKCNLM